MKKEAPPNFCRPLSFCITQMKHLHSPSRLVDGSAKLFGACQLRHEGCSSELRQAQDGSNVPWNTASLLPHLRNKPGWSEGCQLFPTGLASRFQRALQRQERRPLPPPLSDRGQAKTAEGMAFISTQVHVIKKIRKNQSLCLNCLCLQFSRVQWKLLIWLLNDSWQLGVWSLTRIKR